jgi:hypothetical protein
MAGTSPALTSFSVVIPGRAEGADPESILRSFSPPHPEEPAEALAKAGVSKDGGGPPISGLPEIGMCSVQVG